MRARFDRSDASAKLQVDVMCSRKTPAVAAGSSLLQRSRRGSPSTGWAGRTAVPDRRSSV